MLKAISVSVVIPIFNEEANLPRVYEALNPILDKLNERSEVILVNDGSRDTSGRIMDELAKKHSRWRAVHLSRNFGHQAAISAGLDYASGRAVIVMDGDLQDPPEVIPKMIDEWKKGYQVVYGIRKSRAGETAFKKWTAGIFYRLLNSISEVEIPVDAGDFRLLDRKVVAALSQMKESNRYIRGLVAWMGFRQTGVYFERQARCHGRTKFSFRKMLKFALDGILSFSNAPLRLMFNLGILVTCISLATFAWAIYAKITFVYSLPNWTPTFILVSFSLGVQLFVLGLMGEYLSRMGDNVKRRPLYLVSETVGFSAPKTQRISKRISPPEFFPNAPVFN